MDYKNKYYKYKAKYINLKGNGNSNNRMSDYYLLQTKLSYLSNKEINSYIDNDKVTASGITKIIDFDNKKIFMKAIPVAKLFCENQFDTSNLYNLPSYYNYGMGSAGINPWRELLTHIKTSNWVLNGDINYFPLLYHYRIIKNSNKNFETLMDDRSMRIWNNNPNIKKYLTDRENSSYKIVLLMEYIPHVLGKYLEDNPDFVESYHNQAQNIISFLNSKNILHNDAHLFNYLVDDNKKIYLTDFGLTLDLEFKLTKDEKKFMNKNQNIDKYYITDSVFADYFNKAYFNENIKMKYNLDKIDGTVNISKYLLEHINKFKKDIYMSKFQKDFIKNNKKFIIKYIIWEKKLQKATDKSNMFIP